MPKGDKSEVKKLRDRSTAVLVLIGIATAMLIAILVLVSIMIGNWFKPIYTCGMPCLGDCETYTDCPELTWNETRLYSGNATQDVYANCYDGCEYWAELHPGVALALYMYAWNQDFNAIRDLCLSVILEPASSKSCLRAYFVEDYCYYYYDCNHPDPVRLIM